MFKKVFPLFLLCIYMHIGVFSQDFYKNIDYTEQEKWVDSVYASLNQEQRLGQLFMIAAYSNMDERHNTEIESLIKKYNLGGLIFFQGGPVRQAKLTNRYQEAAATPLFIAMDAEWGLGMRLDSTISYPRQMTLGAIEDNQYIYNMGAEIARQFKLMGMHINFAPVVDVNSNPNNPVIGTRSFGENQFRVTQKGIAYMKGLQDNGIIASAKHFPGHGDTDKDSHATLPTITHSLERLKEVELYPFKKLMDDSLISILVGHINIPSLDAKPNQPASLSRNIVTDLLQNEMGFEGLIFTDALNMQAVSKFYKPGDVELQALLAGNDVLLFAEDVPVVMEKIKKALADKTLNAGSVEHSIKKILKAKYWAGLHHYKPVNTDNLVTKLNNPLARLVKQKLFEQAITVVKSKADILPVQLFDTLSFASLSIGIDVENEFQATLNNYARFTHYKLPKDVADLSYYTDLMANLKHYNLVVVNIHGMNNSSSRNFGLKEEELIFLRSLNENTNLIVTVFGNPYSLKYFSEFDNLICAYEDDPVAWELVPQIIFGGLDATGKLPVTADNMLIEGTGNETQSLGRLTYSLPEDVGLDSRVLKNIDQIVHEAMFDEAMPGCQVLVARKGEVVMQKSYGYHTYENEQLVNNHTLYDLASISKVAGTLQAIMFLEEKGLIGLNDKISDYLPDLKGSNKEDIVIKDVLLHQAGLKPYIPFWQNTLTSTGLDPTFYSIHPEQGFDIQMCPGLYAKPFLADSVWHWIVKSEMLEKKKNNRTYDYTYSDISFMILQKLAEKVLNQPQEDFLEQNFYTPLGLGTLTYQPLCKFPEYRIAPTEYDDYFRNTQLVGVVHDQNAAVLGGVAGHAGLFSNANDLAILLQMNLQDGTYGGTRFFYTGTVGRFAEKGSDKSRRGLGWDKPDTEKKNGPTSSYASPKTFGHTGFSGTAAWVDPEFDLIFIFLSNRIFPDANNNKLLKNNIRTKIQHVVYEAMWSFEKTLR